MRELVELIAKALVDHPDEVVSFMSHLLTWAKSLANRAELLRQSVLSSRQPLQEKISEWMWTSTEQPIE